MNKFFYADMERLKRRMKWPTIIAAFIGILFLGFTIVDGDFIMEITQKPWEYLGVFFGAGGLIYGWNIIMKGFAPEIRLDSTGNEVEYYPAAQVSGLKIGIFLVAGIWIGGIIYLIDVIRYFRFKMVEKKNNSL